MNLRKIITLIAVLFILAGTLYMKGRRPYAAEATAEKTQVSGQAALLDLFLPG